MICIGKYTVDDKTVNVIKSNIESVVDKTSNPTEDDVLRTLINLGLINDSVEYICYSVLIYNLKSWLEY